MNADRSLRRRILLSLRIVPLAWVVLLARTAMADPPTAPGQFDQWLQHGEFAKAREWIDHAPPARRDPLRARLARAQIDAGALRAAARTFGELSSSDSLAASPFSMPPQSPAPFGGAVIADFDTLMDLIRNTINPDSWEEQGDGNGTMRPFPLGVLVDAKGRLALRPAPREALADLQRTRETAFADRGNRDFRRTSHLRKVSLTRLERQLALRSATGIPPTEEMLHLAGIYRITHLLFYPESGEIVIAGPASAWEAAADGRHLSVVSGEPTLWLDDWIEIWRNTRRSSAGFYCSIEPRPDNLRRAVDFLARSREEGITGSREQWLESLQEVLGQQDLVVEGIDPRSRAASVILEADYHMKRIGVGLEESVFGVPCYLDLQASTKKPRSQQVLRWWFTLARHPLQVTDAGTAFRLPDQPVQLQSENPRITGEGKPASVGKRDPLNQRFATSFTREYETLARRYPVYADLRNIMHWALVAAVIDSQREAGRIDWKGNFFADPRRCPVRHGDDPKSVQSVVNQRRYPGGRVITAASGGVEINARAWLREETAVVPERYGKLPLTRRDHRRPADLAAERWWWD